MGAGEAFCSFRENARLLVINLGTNLLARALNTAIGLCWLLPDFVCGRLTRIGRCLFIVLIVGIFISQSFIIGPAMATEVTPAPLDAPTPVRSEAERSSVVSADDVSSEKLSAFVTAYVAVMDVVERQEIPWQNAESESEALRLQQELEEDAVAKIEASGLSPAEYLQLLNLIQVDTELGETIAALLQDYD